MLRAPALVFAAQLLGCSGGSPATTTGDLPPIVAAGPDASAGVAGDTEARQECRDHGECPSGVCSHFKKDNGYCAPTVCSPGERADNNGFYCDEASRWIPSKREGEPCARGYECYEATCFMNPMCELSPPDRAQCRDGRCATVPAVGDCERGGGQRVLACDEYMGGCIESLAQRVLRTVCVPCGNGVCDAEECACNCPADCAR